MLTGVDQLPTTAALPELSTVTLMAVAVVLWPAESVTVAESVCGPAVDFVVSQVIEYGGAVTTEPRLAPSSRNWTPEMASEVSVAVAATVVKFVTVELGAGELIVIEGGVPPPPLPPEV